MPRGNPKYHLQHLMNKLEHACPGITHRIPSASNFEFWTDNTKEKNLWVRIGCTAVDAKTNRHATHVEYPVWVRVDNKDLNTVWCSHAGHVEKILHWNKELARNGTMYSPPFDHLAPIQYKPPASSKAESLKWFAELRALTLFTFVWCGKRAEFVDLMRGEAFQLLLHVLERIPKERSAKRQKASDREDEVNSSMDEAPARSFDTKVGADDDLKVSPSASDLGASLSTGNLISEGNPKKRTHGDFVESQKD